MPAARTLDRTSPTAPSDPSTSRRTPAASPPLDPRARRTVVAWRLRRTLARRIVRL